MRLPWQQPAGDPSDAGTEAPDDGTYDPYWGEAPADDGEADPLGNLDDEGRAAAQAYAEAQVAAARAEQAAVAEAARAQGFEITASGVAVRDPATAGRWFGASLQEQRPQPPPQTEQPPAAPQPDAEPDRWGDPEGHDRWVMAQAAAAFRAERAPLMQQNQALAEVVRTREAATALDRAKAAAAGNAYLEAAMRHPDFAGQFGQMVGGMKPEQLVDPVQLRYVAAMAGADLDPARAPADAGTAVPAARGNGGRTVSAEMARASLAQTGPMSSSVGTPAGEDDGRIAPEVRQMIERFNGYFPPGEAPSRRQWEIAGSTPLYSEWKQQNDALVAAEEARGRRR